MAKGLIVKGTPIEEIIADIYRDNPGLSGKKLHDKINDDKRMGGRKISLSKVQALQAEWHKNEKGQAAAGITINPLDRPFTIGLAQRYEIPADILPALITLKQRIGDKLTLRKAKWFSYLYPTLYPVVREQYSSKYDHVAQLGLVYMIAKQYAKKEQIFEIITGEISPLLRAPDTTDIDDQYLIKGDLSEDAIHGNFFEIFLPKSCKKWAKEKDGE